MSNSEEEIEEDFYDACANIPIDPAKYDIDAIFADWRKNPPEDVDETYTLINKHFTKPKPRRFVLIPDILEYEPDSNTNPYDDLELFPENLTDQTKYAEGFIEVRPIVNGWRVERYLYDPTGDKTEIVFCGDMDYFEYLLDEVLRLEAQRLYNKEW